jgi:hypothetical protein
VTSELLGSEAARDFKISEYILYKNDLKVYQGPRASLNISELVETSLPYYFRVATILEGDAFGRGKDIIQDFSDVLRIVPTNGTVEIFPR